MLTFIQNLFHAQEYARLTATYVALADRWRAHYHKEKQLRHTDFEDFQKQLVSLSKRHADDLASRGLAKRGKGGRFIKNLSPDTTSALVEAIEAGPCVACGAVVRVFTPKGYNRCLGIICPCQISRDGVGINLYLDRANLKNALNNALNLALPTAIGPTSNL